MAEDTPGGPRAFGDCFWGHNGFDELRRYIKNGGEFCKELAVILQERSELESAYAKGLHKLSSKLVKCSRDSLGTVHRAWLSVGHEMETEADVHRTLAVSLAEDVTRPLRAMLETQHKIRKQVEGMVDKTTRNVHDWRTAEYKSKKQSHSSQRENEKVQDMWIESRMGRNKSEKEGIKMEKQRRKAEELVERSEGEYYTCTMRAERARLEWESAIHKGATCMQTLEEERLQALKTLVEKYHNNLMDASPKMESSCERLSSPILKCDVASDVRAIINAKGTAENIPHQLLPDFYAEDINNVMNRDRRLMSLDKVHKMLLADQDRENKGKQGVENLAKALQDTPNFGGQDSQQDVNDKLQHMRAILAYLEAARHKVECCLAELQHRPRPQHTIENHVHTSRDKQGMQVSVLKVPAWLTSDSAGNSPRTESPLTSPDWKDRVIMDTTHPDSDFDEFSSQGSDREYQTGISNDNNYENKSRKIKDNDMKTGSSNSGSSGVTSDQEETDHNPISDIAFYATEQPPPAPAVEAMGRCKALYDYDANMYDELTIRTGDIIQLHRKQPDGWWVGELESNVGIFPATYVEEID